MACSWPRMPSVFLPVYPHTLFPHLSSWTKGPGPQEICIITGAVLAKIWRVQPCWKSIQKAVVLSQKYFSSNKIFFLHFGSSFALQKLQDCRWKLFCFHQKIHSCKKPCWEKTTSLNTLRSTMNVVVSKPPQALPKYLRFSMQQPPTPAFLYFFLYIGIEELQIQLQQEVPFFLATEWMNSSVILDCWMNSHVTDSSEG